MTLSLIALACHFAGDFPLQSNRMASEKFDDWMVRWNHCVVYSLCFAPFAHVAGYTFAQTAVFGGLLFASHFAIDSKRWAENFESFPTRALWFDQAYHIIALAIVVVITGGVPA